jgi:NAD(P) transhydrogenase subunit alpha
VALVPEAVKMLLKKQHTVSVQTGAGLAASIPDAQFAAAGPRSRPMRPNWPAADCLLAGAPRHQGRGGDLARRQGAHWFPGAVAQSRVGANPGQRRITSFSLDAIPRITRAQSMDTLSSMATIAGYKARCCWRPHLPKFLPMLTTAAGTIRPSQGLILGAGVAGLQAIATARRLGAVVEAFDVRPAVKEQVKSLGATFVEIPGQENLEDKGGYAKQVSAETLAKQQKLLHERAKLADFIISTAQVPGKPAPRLITKEMVADMKPGSVIVDLAAESGGNCELTQGRSSRDRARRHHPRPDQSAGHLPLDASRMFARNLATFILEITNETGFTMDWKNEIFAETCITLNGEVKRNGPHDRHAGHDLHFHPRHLHRRGGDQPGADGPAHAADVRGQRHSRHRADRRRHRAGHGGGQR